jgi:hypothetical protein
MLTPRHLLTAAFAMQFVGRRFNVATWGMDANICPKLLQWPRALVMTLLVNADLTPGEIGRLLNCPAALVVENCAWVQVRTMKNPDQLDIVRALITDFMRGMEECSPSWYALPSDFGASEFGFRSEATP